MSLSMEQHGAQTAFDKPLIQEYRDALKNLAYAAFGLGVLAFLMGLGSGLKGFKPGFIGAGVGVVSVAWQFAWAV